MGRDPSSQEEAWACVEALLLVVFHPCAPLCCAYQGRVPASDDLGSLPLLTLLFSGPFALPPFGSFVPVVFSSRLMSIFMSVVILGASKSIDCIKMAKRECDEMAKPGEGPQERGNESESAVQTD